MSEWQIIESAPKDGRQILGFERWGGGPDDWAMSVCYWDGMWVADITASRPPKPTHWQELPPPPATYPV